MKPLPTPKFPESTKLQSALKDELDRLLKVIEVPAQQIQEVLNRQSKAQVKWLLNKEDELLESSLDKSKDYKGGIRFIMDYKDYTKVQCLVYNKEIVSNIVHSGYRNNDNKPEYFADSYDKSTMEQWGITQEMLNKLR